MNPYLTLSAILLVGFIVYFFIRDRIFFVDSAAGGAEPYMESTPAKAPIEIRPSVEYPPQVVAPSGPSAPSVAPPSNEVHHAPPQAVDPYHETHESSDIPEVLRHPERSYRAPPMNDMTALAIQAGIASPANADHSPYQQEAIQGGGEFMPGIMAHDSSMDTSFSAF